MEAVSYHLSINYPRLPSSLLASEKQGKEFLQSLNYEATSRIQYSVEIYLRDLLVNHFTKVQGLKTKRNLDFIRGRKS